MKKILPIILFLILPTFSIAANNCQKLIGPAVDNGTIKAKICEDDQGNMNFRDITTGNNPVSLSSLESGGSSGPISISSAIIANNLWVGGAIRSSNTFLTTAEGHLDASTLINPLPAISGALLYAINGAAINGTIPASSIGNAVIANQNTLQAGTSFYVQQGTVNGALTINGAGTAINATGGNIAFPYGDSIVVSPNISWPSGTNTLVNVFFNSVDDEVDYYTPGGTRSTPVMTQRSSTGRTGFKTTNPSYDLEVNGTMGAQTLTTTSGALNLTIKSSAQIRALTPANQGQYYYCIDCTTVSTCVSTGTAVGSWALITNRGSVCQ